MYNVMKVTSLAAVLIMLSACGDTDPVSSEPSGHAETSAPALPSNTETQTIKSEAEAAQPEKTEIIETRSAESHTHGDASLAVVLEGSQVTVELETPLYNLLGFEHAAETDAQKAAIVKAEAVLSDAAALFVFNDEAGCMAPDIARSVELDVEHGHEDHDEHHNHEEENHDDQDKDEDHDDNHDTHKDVTLQYNYMCKSPKALKNVTVTLFEHFENLSELDLVYLGPNTQKQETLSAAKPRINLTR